MCGWMSLERGGGELVFCVEEEVEVDCRCRRGLGFCVRGIDFVYMLWTAGMDMNCYFCFCFLRILCVRDCMGVRH